MRSGDAAPDGPELGALVAVGALEDVDASLSEVMGGSLDVVNALEFEEDLVRVLDLTVTTESEELAADPETDWGAFVVSGLLDRMSSLGGCGLSGLSFGALLYFLFHF